MFPILGWGRYGPEPFGLSCSLAWDQMKYEGFSFVIAMFFFNLLMPSVIIICCYFGIAIKLYFTYRKVMNNSNRVPNIVKLHRRLLTVSGLLWPIFVSVSVKCRGLDHNLFWSDVPSQSFQMNSSTLSSASVIMFQPCLFKLIWMKFFSRQ